MFCPNCGAQPMARFAANRPVADVLCGTCREEYELKSRKARIGVRVMDGAWATLQARLQADNNPNLLVMRYDARRAAVTNLIAVPKQFFTPDVIERRKPLAATARRAGWVGCNILLGEVPEAGKVRLVREGVLTAKAEGLAKFRETLFLRRAGVDARGWLIEVLKCAEAAVGAGGGAFTLEAMYGFEPRLAALYPGNRHVRPKIRQQLQVLRDAGLVAFLGGGRYRLIRRDACNGGEGAPFPLDGGRAGDGGADATLHEDAGEATSQSPHLYGLASTPIPALPPPIGEGRRFLANADS